MNLARVTLCIVIVWSTAACSGSNDSETGEEFRPADLSNVRVATDAQQLPFDAFQLSDAQLRRMQEAQVALWEDCLSRRGLALPAGATFGGDFVRGTGPAVTGRLLWGGPLGTMTIDHAERLGYHAGPGDPFTRGAGFYIKTADNLGLGGPGSSEFDAVQAALEGSAQEKGCRAEVEDQLDAPLVDTADVEADVRNLAFNDERVQAKMQLWVRCMDKAGMSEYPTVDAAIQAFAIRKLSREERAVAKADVTCTQESGWANFYYTALADYQEQAIAMDPQLFEAALAAAQARLDATLGEG